MSKIVYAYLRKDGSPYYIGIGDPVRPYAPHKHFKNIELRPKDPNRIKILHEGLTFDEAKQIEQKLILQYGRKVDGTGILRNLTLGGEGTLGRRPSAESIQKGLETKKKNGTNKRSPEAIAKSVATRKKNGSFGLSQESHEKRLATIKARGKDKQSDETKAKRVRSIRASGGYARSPEAYKKAAETRKSRGNHKLPAESYARMWETRRLKKAQTAAHPSTQD